MGKTSVLGFIVGAMAAAVIGAAGQAHADIGHNLWIHDMASSASAPRVDTTPSH